MAAKRLKVTYLDGRVEEVLASPRAQVMTEDYIGGFSPDKAITGTFYLGWAALHKAGKESHDFETFLDLIDDVVEAEEPAPDPTPPAQSGDTSSD